MSLNLREGCLNSDHSRIDSAPTVVRGLPLRIAGPLSCVDFSNQQTVGRLSLPWTGLIMTKLCDADGKSDKSPLSIISTNIVGDIFLTELTKNINVTKSEHGIQQDVTSYYWPTTSSEEHVTGKYVTDNSEKLREEWIKDWWAKECNGSKEHILHSSSGNQLHISHLKTAKVMYQMKPLAHLNSNTDCDSDTKLEWAFVQKRVQRTKKQKRSRKRIKFGPQKKIGRPNKRDQQETTNTPAFEMPSCYNLKIITPENHVGQQGIRSSDQVAENKFDPILRIDRNSYFS